MPQQEKAHNDYLEIVNRRKWFLIIPSIIGLIIAVVVAVMLPEYYRSTTMILIEEQQVSESYVKPTDLTPVSSRLNTLSQQIMSRTRLESIANEFKLFESSQKRGLTDKILTRAGLRSKNNEGINKESVIQNLRRDIEVKILNERKRRVGSGGEAFRISYVGTDPQTTMNITSKIASLYIEENLKVREQYAEGTSDFLQSELNKAKLELEEQENSLRRFKEQHMGALPEQLDANLRTLDRLQFELQSVHDGLQNSNNRKALLDHQLDSSTGELIVEQVGPLEIQVKKLKAELHTLRSVYSEIYPDIIMLKNRLASLQALIIQKNQVPPADDNTSEKDTPLVVAGAVINTAINTDTLSAKTEPVNITAAMQNTVGAEKFNVLSELSMIRSKIKIYLEKEIDVRAQIKKYERRVEVTPANEQQMIDIRRDYDISLQNYRSLLEKKLNARLAANLEKKQKGARFRIIDPANLPERAYKPDKKKVVALGFAGGIATGAGLIFLLEMLNPAFRKPEDFHGILNIPVLALIPNFATNSTMVSTKKLRIIKGPKVKGIKQG